MVILACVLVLLVLLGAYIAYRMAFYSRPDDMPPPLPASEQYAPYQQRTDRLMKQAAALPFEGVTITAFDGTRLFARYYHCKDGAPLQIQFHGYRSTSIRDFCGGTLLALETGHNVLLVDQRARGKSGGHTITFGVRERFDCQSWVAYAAERFGKEHPILLCGVSMGAATLLMASNLPFAGNVVGIVADCPYASPKEIIQKVCRDRHLPAKLLYPFVWLGALLFGGFLIKGSAVESVRHTTLPILLLHGEEDRFVPCEMSRIIHAANPEKIDLQVFPEAGHGLCYMVDFPRYQAAVTALYQRVGIL